MILAPWCASEKWDYWTDATGKRYAKVTGRTRTPSSLFWNPLWIWRNDYEQNLAGAPWFEPDKPQAEREVLWALRNPLQNGRLFLWGVADRNYTVEVLEGNPNPMVIQRDDVGETGYQRARLFNFEDGSKDRFFTSYSSSGLVYQWGPQPNGFFGAKLTF